MFQITAAVIVVRLRMYVAIYIGNGQAVHGGWYGSQTVVASVSCDKALIGYVHVG